MAMAANEGELATGRMELLIDSLGPHAHLCATIGIRWNQIWPGEFVVNIFTYYRGLIQNLAVMNQRWHHRFRIDGPILISELLAGKNIDVVRLIDPNPLFSQRKPHLSGTHR